MRMFRAVLACALCAALDGEQRSALFSAVQLAGRTQCSPLPLLVTLSARSSPQCSIQCVGEEGCVAFNFKQGPPPNCELFNELTNNYTEVSGCTLYQVKPVDPYASAPWQHGATCVPRATSDNFTCVCPPLFVGSLCETFYCDYLAQQGGGNAVVNITDNHEAYCENEGGTTYLVSTIRQDYADNVRLLAEVFQRRFDGSVDFYRNWTDYENGFGDVNSEFWLGNQFLAQLTAIPCTTWILHVDLTDFTGVYVWAEYSNFVVGGAENSYNLASLGNYSENSSTSNGMTYSLGQPFSTPDAWNYGVDCVSWSHGAWWYLNCYLANLNGLYNGTDHQTFSWCWNTDFLMLESLTMMIRPSD